MLRDTDRTRRRRWLPALLLLMLPWQVSPAAHGLNASYSDINLTPARLDVVFLISVEDVSAHFPALIHGAGGEPARALPAVAAFLRERSRLLVNGSAVRLQDEAHGIPGNGTFMRFAFSHPLESAPAALSVGLDPEFFERFGPQHSHFVTLSVEGRASRAVVTRDRPSMTLTTGYKHGLAPYGALIWLGVEHILLGWDHLMFLCALMIVGGRALQLVKVVTAFTLAHSLTLALAALEVVALPSRLVEGGIALTVAYVAFDNFFARADRPRWLLTFCFGLVHGFGFANVLAEMNLARSELVSSLLSFNAGVEIGQLAVAAALFPLSRWLADRRYRQRVIAAVSGVIFVFGITWFVQRTFDLSFMPL